jgi:hypothetical protein
MTKTTTGRPKRGAVRSLSALATAAGLLAALAACQAAPAGDPRAAAFAAVAAADKANFQASGYLVLTLPGRRDYVAIRRGFDGQDDVLLGLDLADFMQAGLDPAKIEAADFAPGTPVYDLPTSTLVISFDLGTAAFEPGRYLDKDKKPLTEVDARVLMAEIGRNFAAQVGSDKTTGQDYLALGQVAALEWADQPETTDPDLSISLDPAPLVKAGLDPAKLQLWRPFKPAPGSTGPAGERLVLGYKLR